MKVLRNVFEFSYNRVFICIHRTRRKLILIDYGIIIYNIKILKCILGRVLLKKKKKMLPLLDWKAYEYEL